MIGTVLAGAGLVLGGFFAFVLVVRSFMYICKPNEVLIFSGRARTMADGSKIGYRVVFGGRAFRVPLLESVERMDMTLMPVHVAVQNAYSGGGIPLNVTAIAQVKLTNDPAKVGNAIERFLGRQRSELQRVAKETLEGNLRGTLATLTPEQVNEDRLKFAQHLQDEVDEDLEKLGLHLDTLKIQSVSDDVEYLESIGRKRIAEIVRDAEIAESDAKREAEMVAAEAKAQGDVALSNAKAAMARKDNELRTITAELVMATKSEEERTAAAALTARASAERELQDIRAKLEQVRLMADVVLPAEARRRAAELAAKGSAAPISANGAAQAEVSAMLTQAWRDAGSSARDIFLIQQIENLLRIVVDRVNALTVGHTSIVDAGDGKALARHVASYPATVNAVLEELARCTGIDVTAVLSGARTNGHAHS